MFFHFFENCLWYELHNNYYRKIKIFGETDKHDTLLILIRLRLDFLDPDITFKIFDTQKYLGLKISEFFKILKKKFLKIFIF